MKIFWFDKTFTAYPNPSHPCHECTIDNEMCSRIPVSFCREYGGFKSSDAKIFTL